MVSIVTSIWRRSVAGLLLLLSCYPVFALEPLDAVVTTSPRATVESFIALTKESARRLSEYREAPGPETQRRVRRLMDRFEGLFDLSGVGPALRDEVATETFFLLWEVIARVDVPSLDDIPGEATTPDGGPVDLPARWRLPRTEISIVRIEEGARAGEFVFSADTVKRAGKFFKAVRDRPLVREMPVPDVFRLTRVMTGWMIPLAWIGELPGWTNTLLLGQVLWKWVVLFLLLGLALGLLVLVYRGVRRRPDGSPTTYSIRFATPLAVLALNQLLLYLGTDQLNVTGAGAELLRYVAKLAIGGSAVWIAWLTAAWIAERIIDSPRIQVESLDANLIRLAARVVGILATLALLFHLAEDIGIPVYGLVAGAGVGGIAIALATRSTLENFMGALNLFVDRPVRVGDLCRYDEDQSGGWRPVGRVESIGLRSIKIRKMDRTLITVPNADFAERHIVNLSSCDRFLMNTVLGLRYETTDDQLRYLLAELRTLLHAHPKTIHTYDDPLRVRFIGFGDYALDVQVRAYIRTSGYNEFLAIQEDILLRIKKVVDRAGTGFAFPSRTLYHARDSGLDAERQADSERQVREWASAQELPFPDLPEAYRRQITDTLDYPPEGSPGADAG